MERSPIRSSEKKASKRTFAYWSSFAIAFDARGMTQTLKQMGQNMFASGHITQYRPARP